MAFAGICGSLASGETAHGAWTLKREGFLHRRVTIRRAGSHVTTGILTVSGAGKGSLTLPGGDEYRLTTSGWSRKQWSFQKGAATVVRFERVSGGAAVSIAKNAASAETLSILCLLGCYMPILADADDAAAVASVIACC